jgi:transposase
VCSSAGPWLAAGDNPERLRSEAAFAKLCGVSPVEASSGKIRRHRLNPGGDRHANSASPDRDGQAAMAPRADDPVPDEADGRRKVQARDRPVLKRYVAREVYEHS